MDNKKAKRLRLKFKLSQQEVADKIGISRGHFSLFESRGRGLSHDTMRKLSLFFRDRVVFKEKEPQPAEEPATVRLQDPAVFVTQRGLGMSNELLRAWLVLEEAIRQDERDRIKTRMSRLLEV